MNALSNQYDVVVIGSGFGGAVSASTLTNGSAKVLLVERGPGATPSLFEMRALRIESHCRMAVIFIVIFCTGSARH